MAAIIVYGSLINQEQRHQKPHLFGTAYPVFVKGYKRIFNQEPSWREADDKHRAILNIMESDEDGFNGLLVQLQDGGDFDQLDERERGYDRIAISQSQLAHFTTIPSKVESGPTFSGPIFIYLGKPEKQNDDILPNTSYVELCLRGAKHRGEAFYEQFLQTTYVGGLTLKTFLQKTASSG